MAANGLSAWVKRSIYYPLCYELLRRIVEGWKNVFCYKPISLSSMNYDEYWDLDASRGFTTDVRIDTFLGLVTPGSRVIEIGCGDGTLLSILRDRRQVEAKGYDISARAVEKARARGIDAEVRDFIVAGFDEGDSCDFIILADCLEHLPNPEELVQRVRSRFRNALLISIPNSCYWRYRFRVLFGSFMMQWVKHPGEHLRFWSIRDMHWWLNQLGFEVVKWHPTWGIPVLKHLWPAMFAQNVVYVIKERAASPER